MRNMLTLLHRRQASLSTRNVAALRPASSRQARKASAAALIGSVETPVRRSAKRAGGGPRGGGGVVGVVGGVASFSAMAPPPRARRFYGTTARLATVDGSARLC